MENIVSIIGVMLQPIVLSMMLAGVTAGLIVGAIPGLNATMAMALLTPLTFILDSNVAIMLLCSVYVGALSGGLYSAILLRIPGTSSSIATTFDGFPMVRKGLAGKAIGTALTASFIGGTISFILLGLFSPLLSSFALKFGPAEYFAVSLLGLSTIASVLGTSTNKGLISACMGLLIGTIGADVLVGTPRFNFGLLELTAGFDVIILLIGLFAIPQILTDLSNPSITPPLSESLKLVIPSIKELLLSWKNYLRSGFIGTWIGLLPGAGGSIASLLSYDQARRSSKNKDEFGKGAVEGVIASETANNAVIGGSLIPLLTLGIPGDTPAAVLLAAFIIHGIQAGPLLYTNQPEIISTILVSLYASNILMILISFLGSRYIIRVLRIPKHLLLPFIVMMCMIGSYAVNQRVFDMWVMVLFGLVGFVMETYRFPVAPAILGVILGPIIESNLRRAIQISDNGFIDIISRPITFSVLILVVFNFLLPLIQSKFAKGKRKESEPEKANNEEKESLNEEGIYINFPFANKVVGLSGILLAIFVFFATFTLPTIAMESSVYGPGFYPRIVAVVLCILSAILVLTPQQANEVSSVLKIKKSLLFSAIVAILLYVFLIPIAGFVVSTSVYLLGSFLCFSNEGNKAVLKFLAFATIASVGVYFLFEHLFGIYLPHGYLI